MNRLLIQLKQGPACQAHTSKLPQPKCRSRGGRAEGASEHGPAPGMWLHGAGSRPALEDCATRAATRPHGYRDQGLSARGEVTSTAKRLLSHILEAKAVFPIAHLPWQPPACLWPPVTAAGASPLPTQELLPLGGSGFPPAQLQRSGFGLSAPEVKHGSI